MAQTRYLLQSKTINPCKESGTPSWTFAIGSFDDAVVYAKEQVISRHPDRLVEVTLMDCGVALLIVHAAFPIVYVLGEQ